MPAIVAGTRLTRNAAVEEWKRALADLSVAMGWSGREQAPFSAIVGSNDTVLIKPNWVLHANKGPWGLEPLVTDANLIRATAELLLAASPRTVTIGDAPVQGCDTESLWSATGLLDWAEAQRASGRPLIGPIDFRRTVARVENGVLAQTEGVRSANLFRIVDLGSESLLEPVTSQRNAFRVTQYNPDLMPERHRPGRHEYMVAAEVLNASVIFNLPKLKTHKKAGVTAALKNLIGINGNKEFLPHHRVGSSAEGGDCYSRRNPFKRAQEVLFDAQNRTASLTMRRAFRWPIRALGLLSRYHRERYGLEGAWSGNDTIWRTCLDLNRLLLHADRDGRMRPDQQRRVFHVVDAVVAGQGDGPLAPEPFALGLVLASGDAPAMDWVCALLLGYDPSRLSLVRESFGHFRFPLTDSPATEIELRGALEQMLADPARPLPSRYPEGWTDVVDASRRTTPPIGTTFGARKRHTLTVNAAAAAAEE